MAKVLQNKKRISAIQGSLVSILLYLILVLLLNTVQRNIPTAGQMAVEAISLALACIYWVAAYYIIFRNPGEEGQEKPIKYIVLTLLPIGFFTLASAFIVHFAGGDFSQSWNSFSFVVAPTLFWYLPFGLIYSLLAGTALPFFVFCPLMLVVMIGLQLLGYALGNARRKKIVRQEERRIAEAEKAAAARVDARTKRRRQAAPRRPAGAPGQRRSRRDPFGTANIPQVIYTEAMPVITDEIIEEENKRRKAQESEDSDNK